MGAKNNRFNNSTLISKNPNGFTLVELLIVVSIIGILSIISIMIFRGQLFKGNDAKRKADISRIKVAVEEYEKDKNCYPVVSIVSCTPDGTGLKPYLDKIPCDPTTNTSYVYENDGSACPRWYKFYTNLENTADTAVTPNIGPNKSYNYSLGSANAPVDVSSSDETPGGSSSPYESDTVTGYWGCISGSCKPLNLLSPGQPACNPSYTTASCNNDCDTVEHECVSLN